MKGTFTSNELVWDTTKSYFYYPKNIRNYYSEIYNKNYIKYNRWIDKLSKQNLNNHNWWFSKVASRDERVSNLFHNIVIYKSISKFKNFKCKIKIFVDSPELKKLMDKKKINNIKIMVKNHNYLFEKFYIYIKEFSLIFINLALVKLFFKSNVSKNKKINIVDFFEINQKNQIKKYFGNFIKEKNTNYFYIPTFLSYSPWNIFRQLKKKNILLREYYLDFSDILILFFSLFNLKYKTKQKFLNTDFSGLIKDDLNIDSNFRSISLANQNYILFRNLKKRKIQIENIISWNENQIIDKGWSLGITSFFPKVKYIGYSGTTLHPQFFNLSPTNSELLSGVVPKKIYILGNKYLKSRRLFCKNIKYKITKNNRFKFVFNQRRKYILFLLTGIKKADKVLIDLYNKFSKQNNKSIKIKFHPILPSSSFSQSFPDEITGEGSKIIQSAYVVVTSSYTSGLYESISNNCLTILVNCCSFDKKLFQDVKQYTKRLFLCENYQDLIFLIKNNKKKYNYSKPNKLVRKIFFNK